MIMSMDMNIERYCFSMQKQTRFEGRNGTSVVLAVLVSPGRYCTIQ